MLPLLFDLDYLLSFSSTNDLSELELKHRALNSCTKCEIREALNGEYTISLELLDGGGYGVQALEVGKAILAKPNKSGTIYSKPQIFIISSIVQENGRVKVSGEHIKTLFFNNVVRGDVDDSGFSYEGTPSEIIDEMLNDAALTNTFNFNSDIVTSKSISTGKESLTFGNLFKMEGGFIDVFDGELAYDNFDIYFLGHRGRQTPIITVRDGQLIKSFSVETTNYNQYKYVLPFADIPTNEDSDNANTYRIYGDLINTQADTDFDKILLKDFSSKFTKKSGYLNPTDPNVGPVVQDLKARIMSYASTYMAQRGKALKYPSVSVNVEINVIGGAINNQIVLGDKVQVVNKKTNYSAVHKVTETVFDCITDSYVSVTLGNRRFNLYDFLRGDIK